MPDSHDIIISQDKLNNLKEAVRVLTHEMAHAVSKADDYSEALIRQLELFATDLILSSKKNREVM